MNKIILLGRLTKDPEVRLTPAEKTVCTFTLAVDRPFSKEKKETDFINIVLWGKTAEVAGNHITKGQRLLVEGRLQIRAYDAKDGSGKRYATEVVGDRIEFIERKTDNAPAEQSGMNKFGGFDEEVPF